jgi:uncharacterized protein (TIGR00369 family)
MDQKDMIEIIEASPYWNHLGMKIRCMEPGYAEVAMPFKEELSQLLFVMHGGAVASLLDAAGAVSFLKLLDLEKETITTAEMKLNYLNPVTMDQKEIVATARVVKKGKTLGVALIEAKNGSLEPIAIGIGTYAVISRLT